MNLFPVLSLLSFAVIPLCVGMESRTWQDMAGSIPPAITCLRFSDEFGKKEESVSKSDLLVYRTGDDLTLNRDWRGEQDFSVRAAIGWNQEGICFYFDVWDDEVLSASNPAELWRRDSVELFFAAPSDALFGTGTRKYRQLQLIVSPPDEQGKCLSHAYFDAFDGPDVACWIRGQRTADGYRIWLILPYSTFGEFSPRENGLLRMQFNCNDYDRRDGELFPPRQISINQAMKPSVSESGYFLFRFCNDKKENPLPSLELKWRPQVPNLTDATDLRIPVILPLEGLKKAELSIQDSTGREMKRIPLPVTSGEYRLENLDDIEAINLRLVFSGELNDGSSGVVVRSLAQTGNLLRTLEKQLQENPDGPRLAGILALASSIEFLRLAAAKNSPNTDRMADAVFECEARLALLNDDPLPAGLPSRFRYLELTRSFDTLCNVAFSRHSGSRRNFVAISIPWGNIPIVNAELYTFDTEEEAIRLEREFKVALPHPLSPPSLVEADSVFAGNGHWLTEGVRTDLEVERQVSLYTPECPRQVIRLALDEAAEFSLDAVVVMPDAPPEMTEKVRSLIRERGLPMIAFSDRDNYRYTLIAGTPPASEITSFRHSFLGITGDQLIVRRGNDVFRCGYTNRKLAQAFMEFLLSGKPLTFEIARGFAELRAEELPQPSPQEVAESRDLRMGDVHTHTIFSDGHSTPLGLLFNAPMAGFDFLVISDHDEVAGALELQQNLRKHSSSFPVFAGQEVTMTPRYHINVYPLQTRIDDHSSWRAIKTAAERQGAITQLNHPMTYGTNFSSLWYGDFTQAGFDAVERRVEFLKKWSRNNRNKLPAVTGSTDTHDGIFGERNSTVVRLPDFSEEALAGAIRRGEAAMLDAMSPGYVYGNVSLRRMIGAALRDPETPSRYYQRLQACFSGFDVVGAIHDSSIAVSISAGASSQPVTTLEPESTLILADTSETGAF